MSTNINSVSTTDWLQQLNDLITNHFKTLQLNYTARTNAHLAIIDFMNLEMKMIVKNRRVVYKSKELQSQNLAPQYDRALKFIEQKISVGLDLTPHQSKSSLDPTFNDLLLNNWLIHHLHLSDTKKNSSDYFYERSKFLLFVAISPNDAFLIDVHPHNEQFVFAKQILLEVMDRNWPHLLKNNIVFDPMFTNLYSDEEIFNLRKKGYSTGQTLVNNKIIVPPGIGMTTSGHNLHVVRRANGILKTLSDDFEAIVLNENGILSDLNAKLGQNNNRLEIELRRVSVWPYFVFYHKGSDYRIHREH